MNPSTRTLFGLLVLTLIFLVYPPSLAFSNTTEAEQSIQQSPSVLVMNDLVVVQKSTLSQQCQEQVLASADHLNKVLNNQAAIERTDAFFMVSPPAGKIIFLLIGLFASIFIAYYSYRQLSV